MILTTTKPKPVNLKKVAERYNAEIQGVGAEARVELLPQVTLWAKDGTLYHTAFGVDKSMSLRLLTEMYSPTQVRNILEYNSEAEKRGENIFLTIKGFNVVAIYGAQVVGTICEVNGRKLLSKHVDIVRQAALAQTQPFRVETSQATSLEFMASDFKITEWITRKGNVS